jgi:2-polyprenyl-3-methyl-5-hydroxy-6-metoxy-1,4-benzoquinol methylase
MGVSFHTIAANATSSMTTKQQQEALEYFRKHAGDWREAAEGAGIASVNIIALRNQYVLQVAQERAATRSLLDVGCGTGELVCDAARQGIDASGVDYAPEMIDLASAKAQSAGISGAKFVCASIFDFEIPRERYDVISANGFIEYVSPEQTEAFFDIVADGLAPGGSFVVGSRNRLFNLVSLNEYSLQELATGDIGLVLEEAVQWTSANRIADVKPAKRAPIQSLDTKHARTGVDVTTRFQYTPLQLIATLETRGLQAVEVYPVHIHGVTPAFKNSHPELHASIANLLQTFGRHSTQLLAYASTFMLHVEKGR